MSNDSDKKQGGTNPAPVVENDDSTDTERRRLLKLSLSTVSASIAGISLGSVMLRMPMPAVLPGPSSLVKIGDASAYPVGVRRELEDAKLIIRSDSEGLSAMSLVCTHLGCVVKQTQEGFDCPCHGSKFSPEGKVLRGPAPRALPWFRVSQLPSKKLVVDTKRPVPMGTKIKLG